MMTTPNHSRTSLYFWAFGLMVLLMMPIAAQAAPWDSAASWVDEQLGGTFARYAAGIAIAIAGYVTLRGQLAMKWFACIVLGIVLIFGRKTIVDAIIGLV